MITNGFEERKFSARTIFLRSSATDVTEFQTELYQITEVTFQKRQQLKRILRRENNDLIKPLTFYTTSNKCFGRKPPSVLEKAIRATGIKKHILKGR